MKANEHIANEVAEYLVSFFGRNIDAQTFYEKALLHPLPVPATYTQEQLIKTSLLHLRSTFLKFYKATQIFKNPFDLLRFFAKNEFFVDSNHTAYQRIREQQNRNKEFPFAKAVYEIVCNSLYLNRPRSMRDINMERFVSLFNKSPYSFEDLHYLFGMSQKVYDKLKKDCNAFAENGCRITIAILKLLGFKASYPIYSAGLFAQINSLEELHLPGSFYELLLEDIKCVGDGV